MIYQGSPGTIATYNRSPCFLKGIYKYWWGNIHVGEYIRSIIYIIDCGVYKDGNISYIFRLWILSA